MAQKISKTFSFIGKNIRKIRQAKKISQAEFAGLFNLARPSVGAYEEGRSEPKIETIIQIAKYFRISIDVLLTRELTIAEIYSFDQVKEKLDKAHQLKSEPETTGSIAILVAADKQLDYVVNHTRNDFLKSCTRINIPTQSKELLRVFEMQESDMQYQEHGIRRGDLLIGSQVKSENLGELMNEVIVVVHKSGISCKRLVSSEKQTLIVNSDHPSYPESTINQDEVFELWQVIGKYTHHLNAPSRVEDRLLRIEEELARLKK
jgi:transcriptional regulator with XRE-family HTH domain